MIITVKEARKILGKELKNKLSNEEVEKLIDDLHCIAKGSLKMAMERRIGKEEANQ